MTDGEGLRYGLHGALAAFPRHQAARAVERAGGRLRRGTSRQTSHTVFGRGLLARRDPTALATLVDTERAAGRMLISENGFLRQIGLLPEGAGGTLSRATLFDQAALAPDDLDLLALFDAFERDAEPFTRPATAATAPVTRPVPTSQTLAVAQNVPPLHQKARSLTSAPIRDAIGSGTSMGCIGWPLIAALLRMDEDSRKFIYASLAPRWPDACDLRSAADG